MTSYTPSPRMRTSFSWRLRGSVCRNSANSPCGSTTQVQKSPNGSPSSSSTALVTARGPVGERLGLLVGAARCPAGSRSRSSRALRTDTEPDRRRSAQLAGHDVARPSDVEHQPHRAAVDGGRQGERHGALVVPARHRAVQRERHRVDHRGLAGAGGPDQREVVGAGEVDRGGLAERGEPVHLQQHRTHQPLPTAASCSRAEQLLDPRVVDAAGAEVLPEQLGRAARGRPRSRTAGTRSTGAANSGSIRTSSAFGSSAVTSSRSPARAGSRTQTRRKSSPKRAPRAPPARRRVPRTVRSRAPAGDRDVGDRRRRAGRRPRPGRPPGCSPARRSRPRAARRSSARGTGRPSAAGGAGARAPRSAPRPGRSSAGTAYSKIDWAARSPPPIRPFSTVRWAITRFTASSRNPAVSVPRMSRSCWS